MIYHILPAMKKSVDKKGGTTILERLSQAQQHAENGMYPGALAIIRQVKELDPRNVYVLAFEKQVEELAHLLEAHLLTDEQRSDILESIPGIIERAIEWPGGRQAPADGGARAKDPENEEAEKAAALGWLKDQYFQHAHDYVRNDEYEHALAEIRRVFIIEPGNKLAQDFEKQIEGLTALRNGKILRRKDASDMGPVQAEVSPPAGATEEPELPLVMTEEWSSPQRTQGTRAGPRNRPKGKSNRLLVAILLLLIVLEASALYYLRTRHRTVKPVTSPSPPPSAVQSSDVYLSKSAMAAEQEFTISQSAQEGVQDTANVAEETTSQVVAPHSATAAQFKERHAITPALTQLSGPSGTLEGTKVSPRTGTAAAPLANQNPPPSGNASPSEKREEAGGQPFIPIEQEPHIARLETPRLPDSVLRLGVDLQAVVKVQIDPEGKPLQVLFLTSTDGRMEQSVAEAVMKSQFSPGRMSSGPVTSWLTIPIKFKLRR